MRESFSERTREYLKSSESELIENLLALGRLAGEDNGKRVQFKQVR